MWLLLLLPLSTYKYVYMFHVPRLGRIIKLSFKRESNPEGFYLTLQFQSQLKVNLTSSLIVSMWKNRR